MNPLALLPISTANYQLCATLRVGSDLLDETTALFEDRARALGEAETRRKLEMAAEIRASELEVAWWEELDAGEMDEPTLSQIRETAYYNSKGETR